jgi:hypothetical protein
MSLKIKKTGRTWSIFTSTGVLIEGGFFNKAAAEDAKVELAVQVEDADVAEIAPTGSYWRA